jgi:hypothetical protein
MGAIGFIPDIVFIGFIVDCFVKAAGLREKSPALVHVHPRKDRFAKVDAAAYLRKSPF